MLFRSLTPTKLPCKDCGKEPCVCSKKTVGGGKSDYAKLIASQEADNQKERTDARLRGLEDRKAIINEEYAIEMELINLAEAKASKAAQKEGVKFDNSVFQSTRELTTERKDFNIQEVNTDEATKNAKEQKEQEEHFNEMLEKYRTYEQQRADIKALYAKERDALYNKDSRGMWTTLKDGVTSENVDNLDNAEKQETKAVNDSEYLSLQEDGGVIAQIFENASSKSISDINAIREQAQDLLSYLANTKPEDVKADFGMSAEQLKHLQGSSDELEKVKKGVEELHSEGVKKNPFGQLAKDIKDVFTPAKDGESKDTESQLKALGSSASTSADLIGGLSSGLSDMFTAMGNEDLAAVADGIGMAMESVSNVANGFVNGGIVGGIAAAAGELMKFATMAFEAEAKHQAALAEIQQRKIDMQKEYNSLLIEQNLLFKEGENIFFNDEYGRAKNSIGLTKKANTTREADLSELSNAKVVTGHKKTGLFGWGKGKDTYSGMLDVYDDLIDAEGNLNLIRAQAILETENLSDADKERLQNAIDSTEQYMDSVSVMTDYMSGIFGNLGNSMSDALVDAFKNGTDASEAFEKSVGSMLENLAIQMMNSVLIAPLMDKYSKEFTAVMNNGDLSDNEKFGALTGLASSLVSDAESTFEQGNDFLKMIQEAAAKQGLDILQPDDDKNTTNSDSSLNGQISKSIATEESVAELGGIFRGQWDTQKRTEGYVFNLVDIARSNASIELHTANTAVNTANTVVTLTKGFLEMKTELEAINKNTSPDNGSYGN